MRYKNCFANVEIIIDIQGKIKRLIRLVREWIKVY